jgi:hypothetical protein
MTAELNERLRTALEPFVGTKLNEFTEVAIRATILLVCEKARTELDLRPGLRMQSAVQLEGGMTVLVNVDPIKPYAAAEPMDPIWDGKDLPDDLSPESRDLLDRGIADVKAGRMTRYEPK